MNIFIHPINKIMITKISYEDIFTIWKNNLWPTRTSPIESHSSMIFLGGYDIKNKQYPATFFGYLDDNNIIAVNSGHRCHDNSYRSRGLYVMPEYRNLGIGRKLLLATISQANEEGCDFIWSYPKKSSWRTYAAAGFELASEWHDSELDVNAYCKKLL
jgi:GNAT superfamily N-acetyltransferase